MPFVWAGLLGLSLAAPYILPAPKPAKDNAEALFKLSLILGIVISGITIMNYFRKG